MTILSSFLYAGIWEELLLSFSVITNSRAICDRNVGSDTIPSIHGLRAISMAWVILGHTCIIVFKYSDNMELRKIVEKQFLFQTITNGAFSVDTFFFIRLVFSEASQFSISDAINWMHHVIMIYEFVFLLCSGFLISYIYFRTNAKGNLEKLTKGVNEITAGTFHFLGLIFYRFVRLTAPYMFVLGLVEVSMKYFEHESVFDPPTMDHVNCPKYWWRNVLYINTLFPVEDMVSCMTLSISFATNFTKSFVFVLLLHSACFGVGICQMTHSSTSSVRSFWSSASSKCLSVLVQLRYYVYFMFNMFHLPVINRHFRVASSMLVTFMVTSWITTGFVAYQNNHMPNTDDPLALFDKIYDKPWTRLGPYLVGMSVGWFLFKTNCKIRMSKVSHKRRPKITLNPWLKLCFFSLFFVCCSSRYSLDGSPHRCAFCGWSMACTKYNWAHWTVLPTVHSATPCGPWVWPGLLSPALAATVATLTDFCPHHAYIHSHVSPIAPIWCIPLLFAFWHWIRTHHCIWELIQW